MPSLNDSAALAALNSMPAGAGGPMPPPEMGAPGGGGDAEAGLAMIEGGLASLPPDVAEEARMHVEALRGILAGGGGAEAPMPEMPPAEEPLPPGPEGEA